jgi:putative GTP pyrophosphokinase
VGEKPAFGAMVRRLHSAAVPSDAPSKSQVTRAGKILRQSKNGSRGNREEVERALDVLVAFRATHAAPLIKANMGLRSRLKTVDCPVEVSQRLKRIPTIVDKLVREPNMALGTMGDIGGCRALLDSIEQVRRVETRLLRNGPVVRHSDYITEPRATGYRAVHIIVEYDNRRIEIQLRTRVMHAWAFTVERLAGRLEQDVKGGQGPREVVDWLEAVSEAMALEETNHSVDAMMLERINRLRAAAMPYLTGGRP